MDGTTMVDSPAQHMQALQLANRVRLARSRLKRRVAGGEIGVAEVVTTCPWEAQTMEIGELLCSQRRWGRKRCHRFVVIPSLHCLNVAMSVGTVLYDRMVKAGAELSVAAEQRRLAAAP